MADDKARIRHDVSLSNMASAFGVKLAMDGLEFIGCCPFHAEDTASFTIFTGADKVERYHCFGCGARGDVLDFVKEIKGVTLPEAIRIIDGGDSRAPNVQPKRVEVRDIYAGIEPLTPAGSIEVGRKVTLHNPKRAGTETEWGSFAPSMVFPYHLADGSPLGYVLRHDLKDGRKETPMVMWVRLPGGKECWCRFPFPKPRPLYGLAALREGQVIVVEGEKCKDRLAAASGRNVISWPGGTYGINHTDWTPLRGRSLVIWPDADPSGIETANNIAVICEGIECAVKIMDVTRGAI